MLIGKGNVASIDGIWDLISVNAMWVLLKVRNQKVFGSDNGAQFDSMPYLSKSAHYGLNGLY